MVYMFLLDNGQIIPDIEIGTQILPLKVCDRSTSQTR